MEKDSKLVYQFTGVNFSNWKYRITTYLEEKGLDQFLTKTADSIIGEILLQEEEMNIKISENEKKCKSILVVWIADSQ